MLNKMLGKVKKNKGFTLIELIVVIAIIAILALILIPRFGGFRESAQNTADDATARTIHSAVAALIVSGEIVPAPTASADATITITTGTVVSNVTNMSTPLADCQTALQRLLGTGVQGNFTVTIDDAGDIEVS